jgi:hypothetical protein
MRRAIRMRPMRATGRPAAEEEVAAGTEAPLLETEDEEDDAAEEDVPDEDAADDEKPEEEAEL